MTWWCGFLVGFVVGFSAMFGPMLVLALTSPRIGHNT